RAQELAADGEPVVLIRPETSPEDIGGMIACAAIVTAIGGRTSHAAVVARGIGRPAICGVGELVVEPAERRARFGDRAIAEGDLVSVDGEAGIVAAGRAELVAQPSDPRVERALAWADERCVVTLTSEPPSGALVVNGVEDVPEDATAAPVLIDLEWEGEQTNAVLERAVAALRSAGAPALWLRLPESIGDGDLRLPAARWDGLVVDDPAGWAARLIAARVSRDAD
ncbi:MAG: hypothetical protein ITG02_08170, partial [Patulibacter sp.]|nr:hypothetical protein [Patulibacter sp.]